MDLSLIIIAGLLAVISFMTILLVFAGGRLFFTLLFLKYRLTRGKGLYLIFKKNRDIEIALKKSTPEIKFGKEEDADKVTISSAYNREESTGVPTYLVIEGLSSNVDINKEFKASEQSRLINQNFLKSFNAGVIKGMKDMLQYNSPTSWVFWIAVVAAAGAVVAAYFGYLDWQSSKNVGSMCAESIKLVLQDTNSVASIIRAAGA